MVREGWTDKQHAVLLKRQGQHRGSKNDGAQWRNGTAVKEREGWRGWMAVLGVESGSGRHSDEANRMQ